jgi:hypothetical protein
MVGASVSPPEGGAAMKARAMSGVISARVDTPNPRSTKVANRLRVETS